MIFKFENPILLQPLICFDGDRNILNYLSNPEIPPGFDLSLPFPTLNPPAISRKVLSDKVLATIKIDYNIW